MRDVDAVNTFRVPARRCAYFRVVSRTQFLRFRSSVRFLKGVRFPAAPPKAAVQRTRAGQANTLFTIDPTAGPVRGRDRFIRLKAAEVDAALAAKISDADVAQAEQRALADGRSRGGRQLGQRPISVDGGSGAQYRCCQRRDLPRDVDDSRFAHSATLRGDPAVRFGRL